MGGCALLVAAMVLTTVVISRGGQESLRLARQRLGADVVVVPRGSVTGVEGALLLGNATNTYMPRAVVEKVRTVPGVAQASPQLYLTSMANSSCCSVSSMFMFAFDPTTDFTIEPWLKEKLGHDLQVGQAVGGADVFVPEGEDKIKLYGYDFDLVGNLERTGTNLDQTLFMTFPTAFAMQQVSQTKAKMALPVLSDTASSVMVKVDEGADRTAVAEAITKAVPEVAGGAVGADVQLLRRPDLGRAAHADRDRRAHRGPLADAHGGHLLDVGQRAQPPDRRAQGAGRHAALRAARVHDRGGDPRAGRRHRRRGARGGRDLLLPRPAWSRRWGSPSCCRRSLSLVGLVIVGLLVALAVAAAAAFVPALRASRQEPAVAMRE